MIHTKRGLVSTVPDYFLLLFGGRGIFANSVPTSLRNLGLDTRGRLAYAFSKDKLEFVNIFFKGRRLYENRPLPPPQIFLSLVVLLGLPAWTSAQTSGPQSLITQAVDETKLTLLKGNTHPLARAEFDKGAAPSSLPMQRMLLVLKRSSEQEAALQELLDEQQDKSSPNYHKWLTPEQFGQQFGPSDQDIQAIT